MKCLVPPLARRECFSDVKRDPMCADVSHSLWCICATKYLHCYTRHGSRRAGYSPSSSPSTAARHIPESLMPLPELGTRQRTQGVQPGPEGDSLTILGSEPAWWFAVAGRCRKDVQSPLGRLAQTAGLISIWNLDEFAVEVLKSPWVLPSRTRTLVLPPVLPATRLDNTLCQSRSQSQSPKDGAAYGRTTASARFRRRGLVYGRVFRRRSRSVRLELPSPVVCLLPGGRYGRGRG